MKINLIYLLLLLVVLSSCSNRNLTYFSEHDIKKASVYTEKVYASPEPKIQPDDLLSISITSLSPEANMLFNKGEIIPVGGATNYGMANNTNNIYKEGYLVDEEGFINFPVLGLVKVGGLSKSEVKHRLSVELEKYLKDPIINIRYLNYKITVVGEVNHPSTFTIPSERINIIEALGMAGDMTPYGMRENVLLIREENGVRSMTRLNLNSKEVLNSPYFYLQQNDVVYVEPTKARAAQSSMGRNNLSIALSIASIVSIILSRFL